MKIAIPTQNGQIDPHLGEATEWTFVTVSDGGKAFEKETVPAPGDGVVSVVNLLAARQAGALICGELGLMARSALQMMELQLVPGCEGSADAAIDRFLKGEPQGDPSILEVTIEMDENDPMQCMHDCAKCGGCGDPEVLDAIKKRIPEV